jgi:hypothetical protein
LSRQILIWAKSCKRFSREKETGMPKHGKWQQKLNRNDFESTSIAGYSFGEKQKMQ